MKEFIDYRIWDVIIRIMHKDMENIENKNEKYANTLSKKIQIGVYIDDAKLDEYDSVKKAIKESGFSGNPLSYRKENIIWVIEELDEDAARGFEGVYWSVSDKKSIPTKAGRYVSDISGLGADIIRYINSYDSRKSKKDDEKTTNNLEKRKLEDNKFQKPEKRNKRKNVIADKIKCYVGDEIPYSMEDMGIADKRVHSTNPSVVTVNNDKIIAEGIGEAELICGKNERVCSISVKSNLSRVYYWELFANIEVLLFILGLFNFKNERQCLLYAIAGVLSGVISLLLDKSNRKTAIIFIGACIGMLALLNQSYGSLLIFFENIIN